MELQVADNPEQARYEIRADGELAGFVTYHLRDGVIALLHTETDPRFRGQGVAGRLIRSSLEAAGERHLAVLLDNIRRFVRNEPLRNVADKTRWF